MNWLQGLDIGPDSLKAFQGALADAKTIIWNGPMGVFEFEKFAKGTFGVAETLAELSGKVCLFCITCKIISHLCSNFHSANSQCKRQFWNWQGYGSSVVTCTVCTDVKHLWPHAEMQCVVDGGSCMLAQLLETVTRWQLCRQLQLMHYSPFSRSAMTNA